MSIDISIGINELSKVPVFLNKVRTKVLITSTRQTINRTLMTLRSASNDSVRREYALKKGEINKDFFTLQRARGNNLGTMEATLKVSSRPVSMIRFLKGKKDPPRPNPRKGPKSRRKIRVQIKPGKVSRRSHDFVAKGKGGKVHVFRRKGKKRFIIVKQSVPGVGKFFERPTFVEPLKDVVRKRYETEFVRTFQFNLNKVSIK